MTETTPTAARVRRLTATWPFVRAHLPPSPARVLEIGCGPAGGFVPALRSAGYAAAGVDPVAPEGPDYHRSEFEHHDPAGPLDAIVACTSLHHVDDLDDVLDRAVAALTPGGVVIVVEWAHEDFDESTARWCFDRLADDAAEPGWLHRHRELWNASGASWHSHLSAWSAEEHLHTGARIVHGLQARLDTRLRTEAPYFFSDLDGVTEATEHAAIASGRIRATGIRYVGRKPAPRSG